MKIPTFQMKKAIENQQVLLPQKPDQNELGYILICKISEKNFDNEEKWQLFQEEVSICQGYALLEEILGGASFLRCFKRNYQIERESVFSDECTIQFNSQVLLVLDSKRNLQGRFAVSEDVNYIQGQVTYEWTLNDEINVYLKIKKYGNTNLKQCA